MMSPASDTNLDFLRFSVIFAPKGPSSDPQLELEQGASRSRPRRSLLFFMGSNPSLWFTALFGSTCVILLGIMEPDLPPVVGLSCIPCLTRPSTAGTSLGSADVQWSLIQCAAPGPACRGTIWRMAMPPFETHGTQDGNPCVCQAGPIPTSQVGIPSKQPTPG
jgi:hypothetical protein